jgi:hypothetical protein
MQINLIEFTIIAIPLAFVAFVIVDALYRAYLGWRRGPYAQVYKDPSVKQAARLCERLVVAERRAFRAYLRAPDGEPLRRAKAHLERTRQLYRQAHYRFQRRFEKTRQILDRQAQLEGSDRASNRPSG